MPGTVRGQGHGNGGHREDRERRLKENSAGQYAKSPTGERTASQTASASRSPACPDSCCAAFHHREMRGLGSPARGKAGPWATGAPTRRLEPERRPVPHPARRGWRAVAVPPGPKACRIPSFGERLPPRRPGAWGGGRQLNGWTFGASRKKH